MVRQSIYFPDDDDDDEWDGLSTLQAKNKNLELSAFNCEHSAFFQRLSASNITLIQLIADTDNNNADLKPPQRKGQYISFSLTRFIPIRNLQIRAACLLSLIQCLASSGARMKGGCISFFCRVSIVCLWGELFVAICCC